MIYDVPGRTGVKIEPETIREARRQANNIMAVKEAAGSIVAMIQMHRALDSEMVLYSGDDGLLLPSLAVGARGVVSVAAHLAAAPMAELISAYQQGQTGRALTLHEGVWPLAQELFCDANPVPLKWLMNQLGYNVGGVRPPLAFPKDARRFDRLWQAWQNLSAETSRSEGA